MTAIAQFVAELKRRKVVRVAAVYAVVAWALIQVADVVLPRLALPDWTITLVVVLALFGFPVAVVLAWALEVTPEGGVRRTKATPAPAVRGSRAAILASVGTLAALVGFGSYAVLGPAPGETEAAAVAERSIAVLPFANVSGVEENEYFSDGITEDILTRLAGLEDLRVISRTSIMTYKASELTVPEIAAELGVRYVLEGSVRRVDDRVRITGQLIDALTDEHLWAESYDRTVTDLLALQGEMAAEIAAALAVELSPREERRLGHRPTTSAAAYELYLLGREPLRAGWRVGPARWADTVAFAIDLFRRALLEDSTFAPAYVGLSDAYLSNPALPEQARNDSALAFARRAIELDPQLPDAYVQLGRVYTYSEEQSAVAEQAAYDNFRTALRLNPNHADAYFQLGHLAQGVGNTLDAIRNYRRAIAVDPNNADVWMWISWKYEELGFFPQAEAAARKGTRAPGEVHCALGGLARRAGDTAAAREHLRALLRLPDAEEYPICAYDGYRALGDYRSAETHFRRFIASLPEELRPARALQLAFLTQRNGKPEETLRLLREAEASARAMLEESPEHPVRALTDLARIHLLRGEYDEAVTMLEEAERAGAGLVFADLSGDWFEPLRGRPRFDALMARLRAEYDSLRAQVEREGLHR